jgi:hypothetical protein
MDQFPFVIWVLMQFHSRLMPLPKSPSRYRTPTRRGSDRIPHSTFNQQFRGQKDL